jgi:hypothetical protein
MAGAVLGALARFWWVTAIVALLILGFYLTAVPITQGISRSLELTYNSDSRYQASECLPGSTHITMQWTSTGALSGFQLVVTNPNGGINSLGGPSETVWFDDPYGGTYTFSALNISEPEGSVQVNLNWTASGTIYLLDIAPPPCSN